MVSTVLTAVVATAVLTAAAVFAVVFATTDPTASAVFTVVFATAVPTVAAVLTAALATEAAELARALRIPEPFIGASHISHRPLPFKSLHVLTVRPQTSHLWSLAPGLVLIPSRQTWGGKVFVTLNAPPHHLTFCPTSGFPFQLLGSTRSARTRKKARGSILDSCPLNSTRLRPTQPSNAPPIDALYICGYGHARDAAAAFERAFAYFGYLHIVDGIGDHIFHIENLRQKRPNYSGDQLRISDKRESAAAVGVPTGASPSSAFLASAFFAASSAAFS